MIAGCLWTGDTHDLLGHIYILLILFSYRPPGSVSSSCLSEKQNIKLVWTNDILGVTASQSVLIMSSAIIFFVEKISGLYDLSLPQTFL